MTQKFPLIINIKYKHKYEKNNQSKTSFDIDRNIDLPKREIKSLDIKQESKKEKEFDLDKLGKTIINGFAFLYNKYDDIIEYLKEKYKDKTIKLDRTNTKLQEALMKIYGEPREEITFAEYIELLEFGYKITKIIGRRHVNI